MHIIKRYLMALFFTLLILASFVIQARISNLQLDKELAATLTIENIEFQSGQLTLSLNIEVENITNKKLTYLRKPVEYMITVIIKDSSGRTLNRNEVTINHKARHSDVENLTIKSHEKLTFNRSYKPSNLAELIKDKTEVYIQTFVALARVSNKTIKTGVIKTNKIKITLDMLTQQNSH